LLSSKLFCKVNFFPAKTLFAQKDFPFPEYQQKNLAGKGQGWYVLENEFWKIVYFYAING
jgi:hypothetical protein